jgi:apolipoprotein N-acyltransferase
MTAISGDITYIKDRLTYLWLIIGAALLLVSNGHWIIPLATWLAPIFLIRFSHTQPKGKGLVLLLAANILGSLFIWQGIIPPVLYVPVSILIGGVYWLPYLADRLLVNRLNSFTATLVFPCVQVVLEYINTGVSPLGNWGTLAYSQYTFLPLLQLLSITGVWGVSFLIAWLAPVVNMAWEQDFALPKVRTGLLIYGGIMVMVLVYGCVRLVFFPPQSATVQVASITGDRNHFDSKDLQVSRDRSLEFGKALLEQSRQLAQSGAKVILWQEAIMVTAKSDEAAFIEQASALAREEKVYLLLGMAALSEDYPKDKMENQAVWITPSGEVKWHYLKTRPVPGMENLTVGDGSIPVDQTDFGAIASVICFDMDHPIFINQAGHTGVDIMLVPSNDWPDIVPFHTYMAMFRGIENGFSVVRGTGNGLSAAFDYQGRTLAASNYATTKQPMISFVPIRGVRTIYGMVGDLFAWLCIAGFAVLVGLALFRQSRAKAEHNT